MAERQVVRARIRSAQWSASAPVVEVEFAVPLVTKDEPRGAEDDDARPLPLALPRPPVDVDCPVRPIVLVSGDRFNRAEVMQLDSVANRLQLIGAGCHRQ